MIKIKRETLSDGSIVFNVHVSAMVVACESEAAAQRFADGVAELHNEYNVHDADIAVQFDY